MTRSELLAYLMEGEQQGESEEYFDAVLKDGWRDAMQGLLELRMVCMYYMSGHRMFAVCQR